jgi:hypothetical protein
VITDASDAAAARGREMPDRRAQPEADRTAISIAPRVFVVNG